MVAVVTRIQNRRGIQSQFNALYPPGYNGIGGFGSILGFNITNYPGVLLPGEIALCTDTNMVFLGNINGEYIELAAGSSTGATGTVTSVGVTGSSDIVVDGSPITTSGVIELSLSDTSVVPGAYTSSNITIDSKGRITSIENGTAPNAPPEVFYVNLSMHGVMAGNLIDQYTFNTFTDYDTSFAIVLSDADIFQGIEFLIAGKYRITLNYFMMPETASWPTGVSSFGFDLSTFSTGINGYSLAASAYMLKSVNTRYNPEPPSGLEFLAGNGPPAFPVSTSETFILDAGVGAILWPAAYVSSFQTTDTVDIDCWVVIDKLNVTTVPPVTNTTFTTSIITDVPIVYGTYNTIFTTQEITDVPIVYGTVNTVFTTQEITDVPIIYGTINNTFSTQEITDVPIVYGTANTAFSAPVITDVPIVYVTSPNELITTSPSPVSAGELYSLSIEGGEPNTSFTYTSISAPPTASVVLTGTGLLDVSGNATVQYFGGTAVPSVVDSSPTPKAIITAGNAKISSAQSKVGGASLSLDGTGDYLAIAPHVDFDFTSGDFTIDFWARPNTTLTTGSTQKVFISKWSTGALSFLFDYFNGTLRFYAPIVSTSTTGATIITATKTLLINTWYHLAIVRAAGNFVLYVDGVQVGSAAATAIPTSTSYVYVGYKGDGSGVEQFNGYMDYLRVTKGVGRYTGSFTPPSTISEYNADIYASNNSLLLKGGLTTIAGAYSYNVSFAETGHIIPVSITVNP